MRYSDFGMTDPIRHILAVAILALLLYVLERGDKKNDKRMFLKIMSLYYFSFSFFADAINLIYFMIAGGIGIVADIKCRLYSK